MKTTPKSLACVAASCLLLTGCARAPEIDIIGSFFPAWMICLTAGVVLAFVVRYVLFRYRLESEVGSLALFYPCIVILLTCLLWLILFR
jgi:YtcA family